MAAKKSKPNGVELAVGYVSLTVDASNVGKEVETELGQAGKKGGKKAGKEVDNELGKSGAEGGKKAGDSFSKALGEKAKEGAKAAGVAIGAAAGAGVAVGLTAAAAQADLVGSMKAQLGTTPEYAKEIATAAGEAYRTGWGESLGDMGKTAGQLGQVLNDLGDGGNLKDLTVKATVLAQTFEQDASRIAGSASALVKNGMAGSVDEAFDLMTAGFQSNTKLSEDFLDSIDEYGASFKTLGLDGAEVMGLMNQGIGAGAWNGDVVADGLREFMIMVQAGDKPTVEAFESMGMSAGGMQAALAKGGPEAKAALQKTLDGLRGIEDPVKRSAAAVGLFGPKAEEMQAALLALDPSKAGAGLGELSGRATQFVADSSGMGEALASITRNLTDGLGAALTPLLPQLLELSTHGLEFFKWLGANPIVTQVLLGIGAALGVVTAMQWAFNAAQLANPVTWIMLAIMAAIALVIGIIWLFAANWDAVTQNMGRAGNMLHIGLAHVWNGILHGINGVIHGLNGLARGIEAVLSLGGMLGDWNWGEIPTVGLVDIPALTGGAVPGAATGGTVTGSGTVLIGEEGPELLQLPRGASVVPLDHPAAADLSRSGSGSSVTINNINPVGERSSESTRKAGQYIGAGLV